MIKKMKTNVIIFVSLMILSLCCHSQENKIDTIYIYKGSWSHDCILSNYPEEWKDDYTYLILTHQDDVMFQREDLEVNNVRVIFTVNYSVDSLQTINFVPDKLSARIHYIQDINGHLVYRWSPPNTEEYDSDFFDYSCIETLNEYLRSIVKDAKLHSKMHGFKEGKEGVYAFEMSMIPNNIECIKETFDSKNKWYPFIYK